MQPIDHGVLDVWRPSYEPSRPSAEVSISVNGKWLMKPVTYLYHYNVWIKRSMGVLWNFVLTSLLLTNAVCILHEKRFLRPHGWHKVDSSQGMTIKNQIVGFLIAVQYLRFPLMIINTLMILLELVMG